MVLKALRESNHAYSRYYLNVDLEDVSFDFDRLEDVMIGSDFVVRMGRTPSVVPGRESRQLLWYPTILCFSIPWPRAKVTGASSQSE